MKLERVSSTSLNNFFECPRKFRYQYHHPIEPSEAMAFGTVFHAMAELRQTGHEVTEDALRAMTGNYDDPHVALDAYPHVWGPALEALEDIPPEYFDLGPTGEVEKPLADWGLTFGDVRAEGFIDTFDPDKRLVSDWKTRKSFAYAPRTSQDFHDNVQLCYYGAAAAQVHGWDYVILEHRNVLRESRGFLPVQVRIDAWYLQAVWAKLENEIVPGMVAAIEAEEAEVERVERSCYKYGPCNFIKRCVPYNPIGEGADFFDLMEYLT